MEDLPWIVKIEDETDARYGVKTHDIISGNDGDICNSFVTMILLTSNPEPKYVIDIGADEGWWSFFCLDWDSTIQIDAFEPNPLSYKKLASTLKEYPTFNLHNVAISDKEGELSLCLEGGQTHSREEVSDCIVSCKPLMNYVGEKIVDVMKIDVEGHELKILESIHPYLKQFKSIIFEFTVNWYGTTRDECINKSIQELLFLKEHYKYMYSLSRRGDPIVTELLEDEIAPLVIKWYTNQHQTDILVCNERIV